MPLRRILLVEDEPTIAVTLGDDLEHAGFLVTCCRDGAEALRLLLVYEFDAVVTDLGLPGADGRTVLRAAKGRQPLAPVLVISSDIAAETAVRAQGADGFVAKPFANATVLGWLHARGRWRDRIA